MRVGRGSSHALTRRLPPAGYGTTHGLSALVDAICPSALAAAVQHHGAPT